MADVASSEPLPTEELAMEPARTEGESNAIDATDATANKHDDDHNGKNITVTNGAENHGKDAPTESIDPTANMEDTEMKDVETPGPGASGSSPAAPVNGTSLSAKKGGSGSSKKKSSAVPEHKSKKINRKKSRPMTHLDAQPGEYYFGRLRGHPPWPSIICDEEMLPQVLLESRPVTTKQSDGTYKKPEYADGGKRAYERTFPIMFLQTNEFAWIPNTELQPLNPEACKEPNEKGKSKSLLAAFQLASENHDLAYFKGMLADHQRAMQEDIEADEEREAKKASKAKRKSTDTSAAIAEEDVDMEDEEGGEDKPKAKKRKKNVDSDGETEKPTKTPKTATKLKLSTPKTPTDTASKKKLAQPKKSRKSAARPVTSDEDVADAPKVEEKPLTPQEAKQKKEREVLFYRHKLQRGFLSRDTMPKEEEMKSMSDFLAKLETYPDLEGSIIRATKIHKVLKGMIKLTSLPKDETFNFKKRSHELLAKWNKILQEDPNAAAGGDKDDDAKDEVAATTNGDLQEEKAKPEDADEQQAGEAETGEAAAPEDTKPDLLESKIGITTESAKEAEVEDEEKHEPAKVLEQGETDERKGDGAPTDAYQSPSEAVGASA